MNPLGEATAWLESLVAMMRLLGVSELSHGHYIVKLSPLAPLPLADKVPEELTTDEDEADLLYASSRPRRETA